MYLKVEDNEKLVRDSKSKAVINTSAEDYHSAVKRRESMLDAKVKQEALVDDINNIKEEVDEIKGLLREILKRVE